MGIYLAAFFGFWILFTTQLSNVDLVARQVTDMLWSRLEGVRRWAKEDIRRLCYVLLVIFVVWGAFFIGYRFPLFLVALSANMANFDGPVGHADDHPQPKVPAPGVSLQRLA